MNLYSPGRLLRQKLKQKLNTSVVLVWRVLDYRLGGLNEISVVRLECITSKNTIDQQPVEINIPATLFDALINSNILESV